MAQVKVKLISCLNHVCKIPSPLPQHVTQYERGHHLFIGCNAHRGRGVQGTVCWGRSLGDHGQVGVSISSPGPQERGSLGHGQLPFTRRHPAWESPGAIYFTLDIGELTLVQHFGGGVHLAWGRGEQMCLEDGAVSFSALAAKSCTVKQHRDPVSAAQTPLPLERSLCASLRVPCSNLFVGGCLLRGPWPNGSACSARLPLPNPATSLL